MRSPDDVTGEHQGRRALEVALRAVALLALGASLLRSLGWWRGDTTTHAGTPLIVTAEPEADRSATLVRTLRRAIANATGIRAVHVDAARVPNDTQRALLSAARAAGVPLTWTDSTRQAAVAIEASAVVDPRGGVLARIAAPSGTRVVLHDTLGAIDSLRAQSGGASLRMGRASGTLAAVAREVEARVPAPTTPVIRRILLVARPGWEAKFTLAALEECGWQVDARFAIAPRVSVTQGAPTTLDTAQYSAVVALDSTVLPMTTALVRYAHQGGGVVLAGEATTLRALDPLLAGAAGPRQPGVPGGLVTQSPRVGLALWPITSGSDAVVLERTARGAAVLPVVVARRLGAGRIVQVGYDALWEWRMQGGEGSVAAHRDWWGRLVSSVAFAPVSEAERAITSGSPLPGDAAPYADLVARLGAPTAMPAAPGDNGDAIVFEPWLFVLAAVALLVEWGSRRLRGAR